MNQRIQSTNSFCLRPGRWLFLASLAWNLVMGLGSHAAQPAATSPAAERVDALGNPDCLIFEGNKTFTRDAILRSLTIYLEFHIASHPSAPLADYLAWLERTIVTSYQRGGFANVKVTAQADRPARRLLVRVAEGTRYKCGTIRVLGTKTDLGDRLAMELNRMFSEPPPDGKTTETQSPSWPWKANEPAPCDERAGTILHYAAMEALGNLNVFDPKVRVEVKPDPARGMADLVVEVLAGTRQGIIEEITVSGLKRNTRENLLDFLKLKPGMIAEGNMAADVSNRLWNAARFVACGTQLTPLPQPGKFRLGLDVMEYPRAPLLNQDFSPEEKALLKLRNWLLKWDKQSLDLITEAEFHTNGLHLKLEFVLTPGGIALVVRDTSETNQAPLRYACVASPDLAGFFSGVRQQKFTGQGIRKGVTAFCSLLPTPELGDDRFNFYIGAGFKSSESAGPFRLDFNLAPVSFIHMGREPGTVCQIENGVMTVTSTDEGMNGVMKMKVDGATGRLIEIRTGGGHGAMERLEIRTEEKAFAKVAAAVKAETGAFAEAHSQEKPLGSFIAFAAADLVKIPGALKFLGTNDTRDRVMQTVGVFQKLPWGELAAPFESMASLVTDTNDSESFPLVLDSPSGAAGGPAGLLRSIAGLFLKAVDLIYPPGSWPWTLTREGVFGFCGGNPYSSNELSRLRQEAGLGPLACLAASKALGRFLPDQASLFAELGATRLNPDDLQKDLQTLSRGDASGCRLLRNIADLSRVWTSEDIKMLGGWLGPENRVFLAECVTALSLATNQPPDETLRPVLRSHWDKSLKPHLLIALETSPPRGIPSPATAEGMCHRGKALASGALGAPDMKEAAALFRKAAGLGLAEGQFDLAQCLEMGAGVRQDRAEAARCYRQAANQGYPHAGCKLGRYYSDGQSAPKDLDEARKWFLKEAERDCAEAQCSLGLIAIQAAKPDWEEGAKWFRQAAERHENPTACYLLGTHHEQRREMPEALGWYERAANAGMPKAMAELGDRLCDGFSTKPDYVAAYKWLSLAAQQGDKIAEVGMKRVARKLTPEQTEQATRQATEVIRRLKSKQ